MCASRSLLESVAQTKRRAVGRLTQPDERQDWLRVLLLMHYEKNGQFWRDWIQFLSSVERLLEALTRSNRRSNFVSSFSHQELGWLGLQSAIDGVPVGFGSPALIRRSVSPHLDNYRSRLMEFADGWGLRCRWAPAWIHHSFLEWIQMIAPREWIEANWDRFPPGLQVALREALTRTPTVRQIRGRLKKALDAGMFFQGKPSLTRKYDSLVDPGTQTLLEQRWARVGRRRLINFPGFSSTWEPESTISIEAHYDPWPNDNWADVERRVVAEAREQREAIIAAYLKAGFRRHDDEPRMPEHIRWLYLRICPREGSDRPMVWKAIAKTEDVPESQQVTGDTVKWTVEKLAKEMGITLPAAQRGRPRRFVAN
jgi:hypothetical protein